MTRTANSSLTNALRILKCFSIDKPELNLSEISEILKVSKSTACRLVQTLESEGFIYQNSFFNTYSLGSSVLALANTAVDQFAILKETTPFLKKLSFQTNESVHIAILEKKDVIYLKKEDSEYRVELRSHIGRRNPAHCTASGLAILAYLNSATITTIFTEPLTSYTKYTITSLEELHSYLQEVRENGYALSKGHFIEEIVSVGAPIFNKNKMVVASLTVTGPVKRMIANIDKMIDAVVEVSNDISIFIQTHEKDVDLEAFIR
ncbi:IclR family transcriptional regulator [Lysinibacillus yapensis]|uniref:IclR family transcriptional regulator n=1 Tax=Ureibacillus yapensis TaxID=2304605 RepID=A0A396SHQ1_9BACL|nr:IclR family transcriptional regulator [Lysinibacillus yapensis]RHW38597.1 IclR family transcriptional regulator [Lysinibacillus yapensis]